MLLIIMSYCFSSIIYCVFIQKYLLDVHICLVLHWVLELSVQVNGPESGRKWVYNHVSQYSVMSTKIGEQRKYRQKYTVGRKKLLLGFHFQRLVRKYLASASQKLRHFFSV